MERVSPDVQSRQVQSLLDNPALERGFQRIADDYLRVTADADFSDPEQLAQVTEHARRYQVSQILLRNWQLEATAASRAILFEGVAQ